MTAQEKALLLLREIREALARGTQHYDQHGKRLETLEQIIEALLRDDTVTFEPPPGK